MDAVCATWDSAESLDEHGAPSSRADAITWVAPGSVLMLFGGQGPEATPGADWAGYLPDAWQYLAETQTWLPLPPAGNRAPRGRAGASVWTDDGGNAYIFGGVRAEQLGMSDAWVATHRGESQLHIVWHLIGGEAASLRLKTPDDIQQLQNGWSWMWANDWDNSGPRPNGFDQTGPSIWPPGRAFATAVTMATAVTAATVETPDLWRVDSCSGLLFGGEF